MIAVIGAGPAGLSAAVTAAKNGESVILIDSSSRLGGQYWRHLPGAWNDDNKYHYNFDKAQKLFNEVLGNSLITWYSNAHVWQGEKRDKTFHLFVIRNGVEEVVLADKVILATGAYDRALPFPGWTNPGVMTPGGAQSMLKSHGVVVGNRVVIAGTGPFLLPVAAGLIDAGAKVVGLFEANKPWRWILNIHGLLLNPSKIGEAIYYFRKLRRAQVQLRYGKRVESFEAGFVTVDGNRIACDAVAVGWGFVPDLSLAGILGAKLKVARDGTTVVAVDTHQQTSVEGLFAAGESTGIGGSSLSIIEGRIAASGNGKFARFRAQVFARGLQRVYPVSDSWQSLVKPETILCRCEEVSMGDVISAVEDLGAEDARTAKLFTRAGMGLCQGRMCARNVGELVACHLSLEVTDSERINYSQRPLAGPISLGELGDGLGKDF